MFPRRNPRLQSFASSNAPASDVAMHTKSSSGGKRIGGVSREAKSNAKSRRKPTGCSVSGYTPVGVCRLCGKSQGFNELVEDPVGEWIRRD